VHNHLQSLAGPQWLSLQAAVRVANLGWQDSLMTTTPVLPRTADPFDRASAAAVIAKTPTQALLAGVWSTTSGEPINVTDPANGEVLTTIGNATSADLLAVLDTASAAQRAWAKRPSRERAEILRRSFDLMIERCDEIALIMTLESGKTIAEARGEVTYAAEFLRWFSEETVRIGGEFRTAPSGVHRILTIKQPIGIAYLITPWNFPAAMMTRKIGPALAAGNAVVVKPATETPLTAYAIAQIFLDAGVEPGVLTVLTTKDPNSITEAAFSHPAVRKLSFTGSTQVGRMLLEKAAGRILRTSMELGGNAPFIVMEDANLEKAIEGAMIAKMRNCGQACTAANRFIVHTKVHDQFVNMLSKEMGALKLGHGTDPSTTLAPLVSRKAHDQVSKLVDIAVKNGGQIALGATGTDGPGAFYAATVLADVPVDSPLLAEEIFGPVLSVLTFRTPQEAIDKANNTPFGLSAGIWSDKGSRILWAAKQLRAGVIWSNTFNKFDPASPFGGYKESGWGREGGRHGLNGYLKVLKGEK
jgi:succinate-semialdehyde dehydrogenase/glutarate-semialdehyde dehydrogenase